MKRGGQASIPPSVFPDIRQWYREGAGCRKIARLLENRGVYTTKSSVDRLLRGRGVYTTCGLK